jgi:uncharacterized protein (TIGR03067 family)
MRVLLSFVAATLLLGADAPAEAIKKEMMLLEGEWSMVSGERDGQKLPDELVKTGKRTAKDGETSVTLNDMLFMKAKFNLDPSKKPKQIDYTITEGAEKGKIRLGIYEIDGDTAKFCFGAPGDKRPTDFTAKEGSDRTLSVWKRNKK